LATAKTFEEQLFHLNTEMVVKGGFSVFGGDYTARFYCNLRDRLGLSFRSLKTS